MENYRFDSRRVQLGYIFQRRFYATVAKRQFTIDIGTERIAVDGYEPRAVALKYLMKKRRSLLATRDKDKVEAMYLALPHSIRIDGARLSKSYEVNWERIGTTEFEGARFTFTLEEMTD